MKQSNLYIVTRLTKAVTNPQTEFQETFGHKPIFAGVYTTAKPDQMITEVNQFTEAGIHVYIDSIRARKNQDFSDADEACISTVLESLDLTTLNGKVGVNFLFNPQVAYKIAERYGLSFVVDDAMISEYNTNPKYVDESRPTYSGEPNISLHRSRPTDITLIGGISPGYQENISTGDQWREDEKQLYDIADAVLIGNAQGQSVAERLGDSSLNRSKPVIAAQGVSAENLEYNLANADAVIIGSGFREGGKISEDKMMRILSLRGRV